MYIPKKKCENDGENVLIFTSGTATSFSELKRWSSTGSDGDRITLFTDAHIFYCVYKYIIIVIRMYIYMCIYIYIHILYIYIYIYLSSYNIQLHVCIKKNYIYISLTYSQNSGRPFLWGVLSCVWKAHQTLCSDTSLQN